MATTLNRIKKMLRQREKLGKIIESFRLSLAKHSRVVYKGKEYRVERNLRRVFKLAWDEVLIYKTTPQKVMLKINILDIEKLLRDAKED